MLRRFGLPPAGPALSLRAVSRMMKRRRATETGRGERQGSGLFLAWRSEAPLVEKAGRPEEAGALPGTFDEERRRGRCPPRKAISD